VVEPQNTGLTHRCVRVIPNEVLNATEQGRCPCGGQGAGRELGQVMI